MSVTKSNLNLLPAQQVREGVSRRIVNTDNLMMAIIDFVNGPWDDPEPFHSHHHEQVSYVAKGEIIFYCEDRQEQHLKEGDVFAVPSGKKHTIKILTSHVRLVDNFTPLRDDFLK